jgi:hypothetical protein
MKDWKQLAAALVLPIPPEDLEKAATALDRIEAEFRPLVKTIPFETEPAYSSLRFPEDEA